MDRVLADIRRELSDRRQARLHHLKEIYRSVSDKDDVLYHYTDYLAFNGILRDRELRVNNVRNMNDTAEMELFMNGIFRAVERRLEEEHADEKLGKLRELAKELNRKYFDYAAYAACFSTYRDDASQWERYANRGKGVCLGIDRRILERMTGGAITLQKVYYQDDVETHPLVKKLYDLTMSEEAFTEDNPALRAALADCWRNSASFKHPSFSSEHEVRLVVMPFGAPDFDIKAHYHVTRERIKKYYPLDLDAMCRKAGSSLRELITEIIVGPESTQSIPIIQDYLRDLSLDSLTDRVCLSDCPLRSKM